SLQRRVGQHRTTRNQCAFMVDKKTWEMSSPDPSPMTLSIPHFGHRAVCPSPAGPSSTHSTMSPRWELRTTIEAATQCAAHDLSTMFDRMLVRGLDIGGEAGAALRVIFLPAHPVRLSAQRSASAAAAHDSTG